MGGDKRYALSVLVYLRDTVRRLGVQDFLDTTIDIVTEAQFISMTAKFTSRISGLSDDEPLFDIPAFATECMAVNSSFDMREFLEHAIELYRPGHIFSHDELYEIFIDCGLHVSREEYLEMLQSLSRTESPDSTLLVVHEWIKLVETVGINRFIETIDTFYDNKQDELVDNEDALLEAFLAEISSLSNNAMFDLGSFLRKCTEINPGFDFNAFTELIALKAPVEDSHLLELFKAS